MMMKSPTIFPSIIIPIRTTSPAMIMIPSAERKHLTKQRPQSGNTPDDKSDAIFGISPNHDVCDTVEIIVGVVEIDGIFESDAG